MVRLIEVRQPRQHDVVAARFTIAGFGRTSARSCASRGRAPRWATSSRPIGTRWPIPTGSSPDRCSGSRCS